MLPIADDSFQISLVMLKLLPLNALSINKAVPSGLSWITPGLALGGLCVVKRRWREQLIGVSFLLFMALNAVEHNITYCVLSDGEWILTLIDISNAMGIRDPTA